MKLLFAVFLSSILSHCSLETPGKSSPPAVLSAADSAVSAESSSPSSQNQAVSEERRSDEVLLELIPIEKWPSKIASPQGRHDLLEQFQRGGDSFSGLKSFLRQKISTERLSSPHRLAYERYLGPDTGTHSRPLSLFEHNGVRLVLERPIERGQIKGGDALILSLHQYWFAHLFIEHAPEAYLFLKDILVFNGVDVTSETMRQRIQSAAKRMKKAPMEDLFFMASNYKKIQQARPPGQLTEVSFESDVAFIYPEASPKRVQSQGPGDLAPAVSLGEKSIEKTEQFYTDEFKGLFERRSVPTALPQSFDLGEIESSASEETRSNLEKTDRYYTTEFTRLYQQRSIVSGKSVEALRAPLEVKEAAANAPQRLIEPIASEQTLESWLRPAPQSVRGEGKKAFSEALLPKNAREKPERQKVYRPASSLSFSVGLQGFHPFANKYPFFSSELEQTEGPGAAKLSERMPVGWNQILEVKQNGRRLRTYSELLVSGALPEAEKIDREVLIKTEHVLKIFPRGQLAKRNPELVLDSFVDTKHEFFTLTKRLFNTREVERLQGIENIYEATWSRGKFQKIPGEGQKGAIIRTNARSSDTYRIFRRRCPLIASTAYALSDLCELSDLSWDRQQESAPNFMLSKLANYQLSEELKSMFQGKSRVYLHQGNLLGLALGEREGVAWKKVTYFDLGRPFAIPSVSRTWIRTNDFLIQLTSWNSQRKRSKKLPIGNRSYGKEIFEKLPQVSTFVEQTSTDQVMVVQLKKLGAAVEQNWTYDTPRFRMIVSSFLRETKERQFADSGLELADAKSVEELGMDPSKTFYKVEEVFEALLPETFFILKSERNVMLDKWPTFNVIDDSTIEVVRKGQKTRVLKKIR